MFYLPYRKRSRSGFTLVELMVVIGILGLLVGILAVAVLPQLTKAQAQMEMKQLGDLYSGLQVIAASPEAKRKLNGAAFKDTQGRSFWAACFKMKVLESDMLKKVVSLQSKAGDISASPEVVDGDVEFTQNNCSYTSPKGPDLMKTMSKKGKDKAVVLSFDSRNWENYPNNGVLVSWSDGDQAIYVDQPTANSEYGVSKQEWESPGDSLIGRKKPWDQTFEEKSK